MPRKFSFVRFTTKILRWRQGSNLCGQSPMDFKSIALTTRPRQPLKTQLAKFDTILATNVHAISTFIDKP